MKISKILKHYFLIWLLMAKNSVSVWFGRRNSVVFFLSGKLIRFIFYFGFIFFLVKKTNGILSFDANQTMMFAATYILIDTLSQFFFRSVYSFRQLIVTGDLDLILVKPINTLFRVLLGSPDPIDLVTIPLVLILLIVISSTLNPSLIEILVYLILLINGLLISAAFHIVVLSFGIISLEVDHTIMIYRDLSSMGRYPIDIYKEPIKSILTYLVSIGLMITIPTKALLGLTTYIGILSTIIFGISLFYLSIKFWQFALKRYTSASS